MSQPCPKISVLMCAYNAGPFIGEAIASVLGQTFRDFELIIVNDGSTDETEAVIRQFDDPRIVVICQPNKGIAEALNTGLAAARSELIARFDADDICYPHRLEKQYDFVAAHPGYSIIGSAADYVDQKGDFVFTHTPVALHNEAIQAIKKQLCPFIHSSVLYKRSRILEYGGYNAHAHSFEDHLLWVEVLKKEKGCNMQEPLLQVRLNPGSLTIDEKWRTREFLRIKQEALLLEKISAVEGTQLLDILKEQNNPQTKEGAYYALLSKKYLWNNYQPVKARKNLRKVLTLNRTHWTSYLFYLISFFPQALVQKLYRLAKTNHYYGR